MTSERSATGLARVIALGLVVLAIGLFSTLRAQADDPASIDVTVRGPLGGETAPVDTIEIAGMTYADAKAGLDAAVADPGTATLPVAPAGFTAVTAVAADLHYGDEDADEYVAVISGDVSFFGSVPATMFVTAVWDDEDTDAAPEIAIFFSFTSVSLGDLTAYTGPPIELSHSWIGLAAAEHTVEVDALPSDVASLLDDGLATTEDDFTVGPESLAFRGVLSSTDPVIREAASQLGLSGDIRIDGVLSGDISGLGGSEPPTASAGLQLSVSLPTASSSSLPDWFAPTGSWLLELSVESEGTVSASISGSADITAGETTYSTSASVGVEWDGTDATFSLEGELAAVDNLFGLGWLDLETFSVEASFTTAGAFSGGLNATVDLFDLTGQDATGTLAFEFAADSDGSSGSLELTSDLTVSVADIATALGATAPADFNVTINGFALFVGFESGTSGTSVTVAMGTNVVVDINEATISSDLLFRLTTGGGNPTEFLFAVKPDEDAADVTVGELLDFDFGEADITLPRFTLSVSNADWDVSAADLDGPTAAYLGDGEDLGIEQGVVITSEVVIPQQLKDALAEVGIETDGDLELVGKLPVLGSTELSISINFPTIIGAPNEPFREGNLALVFKSPSAGTYQISIEGDVTIGVPRTEDAACAAPYAGACTDELVFDLSATLSIGGPSGIAFTLEGGLTAGDDAGWVEPFGLQGLTIFELRLQVGVTTAPPSLTLGMLGRLQINDTTVTVAFKLGVTANPPFINPIGFTFATNGFGLSDIVDLHEAVSNTTVDESALPPDIRVENVFVAFGTQDDDDLCIRQGFYLAADLHLGGSLSLDAEAPPCEVPPTEPSEATAKCAARDTCIASILLDIDTGVASGSPSVKAAGYFAATELGPLRFDPTRIELELSASTQRLFVSGGAALDDPFDTTPPAAEWVSGSFVLDFNTNSLSFVAEISLAEGELLQARATGTGSLDLDNPQFVVTLEFRSGLLDTLAEELETGFNDFVADVNAFGDRLFEARSSNPVLWRNLLIIMEEEGDQPQWLVDMVATFANVEDTIGGINDTFTSAGLPAPFVTYEIVNIALHGAVVPDLPGIPGPVVSGCVLDSVFGCIIWVDPPGECLGFVSDASGCWIVPPLVIPDIPGLCDTDFFGPQDQLLYRALCTNLGEAALIGDLFEKELENDHGLDLPDDWSGEEILDELTPVFTGTGVSATCGHAVVNFGTQTVSETQVTLVVHGKPVVVSVPLELVDPNGTFDQDNQALQQTFNALLGIGSTPAGPCTTASTATNPPAASLTLAVAPADIDEGGSVTASGIAQVTGDANVDIDWGDGTPITPATIGAGGAFSATHLYDDDDGPGTSTNYTVRASAGTGANLAAASARVTVNNVAPSVSASFNPAAIVEGGTASLVVTFTDPGDDTHTVEAVWSDGVRQQVSPVKGVRTHTFTRTIQDDNPTATSSDQVSATVTVRDKDGESGAATASLTVNNVTPSGVTLTPIGVIGGEEVRDTAGNLVVQEGDLVRWQISFTDVGVRDSHNVVIDWKDGTSTTRFVPANVGGATLRTFEVTHHYVDDNPTGTSSDAYSVELTVTDDDTGSSTDEVSITVHDVAPVITSVTATDNAPEEEEVVTLTIDFTDPGIADTFSVEVDWKDGTIDTYPVAADKRTLDVSHTYDDDDPTGTASDIHSVEITVTDDDTLSDTTTIDLDVTNVDPVIEALSVTPNNHAENASDVVLALEFSDVSVKDSHTVTIDWGAGWSSGNSAAAATNDGDAAFSVDVSDEDARYTVVQVPALADLVDAAYWADGNKSRFLTATNRYGDNGVYTIQVTVVDDDTGQVVDSVILTVDNTDPSHAINDGNDDGATTTAGGQAFIASEGQDVIITDTAGDPGSDDLFFDWLFGDGDGILNTWLVGVPTVGVDDPALSPQVSSRVDVTDSITHSYANACLYGVSVHVTDDDDGDGGLDHVAVVIQALREAGDDRQQNGGQWSAAVRRGDLAGDELDCYLDIAGYMSSVLVGPSELASAPWAPTTGYVNVAELDRHGVPAVLTATPGGSGVTKLQSEQVKLDRLLLSAWLNFADGAWQWDTLIEDSDGDGVLDKTFAEVITEVEQVRNTSTDDKEVQDAWQRLWQLGN